MLTENTSLKNTTPAGDSNITNKMVTGKINTYQRTFMIVAGSLLALIAVAGTRGGQHLQSSVHGIAESAVALADYQVDTANTALTKKFFGLGAASETDEGKIQIRIKKMLWNSFMLFYWYLLTYNLYIFRSFIDIQRQVSGYTKVKQNFILP